MEQMLRSKTVCVAQTQSQQTLYVLRRDPDVCQQLCQTESGVAGDERFEFRCVSRGGELEVADLARYMFTEYELQRIGSAVNRSSLIAGHPVKLSQRELTDSVARGLARGGYCLVEQRRRAAYQQAVDREPADPGSSGETITPTQLRAPQSNPPPVAEQGENSSVDIDQNQQAQALTKAAEDGTPFCEECERYAAEHAP